MTRGIAVANAAGLVVGAALDRVFADPRRWHPVAGFGRAATALERRWYAPSRRAGLRHTAVAVGVPVLAALAAQRLTRRRPVTRFAVTAAVTWAVLGGTSLRREAAALQSSLDGGELAAARARLPHLCGRDPSGLAPDELARAAVESVAENTSDAVVGPLWWGALAGLPGLVGYRAVNTLDAMVGHRSTRYARFGTAAARLDDAANLAPARLTAALTVLVAPRAGGDAGAAARAWRRYGHRHPSPNSGRCEAAAAGALGLRLGGRNVYAGRVEERPVLGDGRAPEPADIARGVKLSAAVETAAVAVCAVLAVVAGARRVSERSERKGKRIGRRWGSRAPIAERGEVMAVSERSERIGRRWGSRAPIAERGEVMAVSERSERIGRHRGSRAPVAERSEAMA
jgi:adenosylcobinamide-phosphate synthase